MSDTRYLTVAKPSEGLYKEKGSRFLAFAFPVRSREEVKEILLELKKKYYDATHHCYAYILGADGAVSEYCHIGFCRRSAGRSCRILCVSMGEE